MPTDDDYAAYYREFVRAMEANVSGWNDPDLYERPAKDAHVPVKGREERWEASQSGYWHQPSDRKVTPRKALHASDFPAGTTLQADQLRGHARPPLWTVTEWASDGRSWHNADGEDVGALEARERQTVTIRYPAQEEPPAPCGALARVSRAHLSREPFDTGYSGPEFANLPCQRSGPNHIHMAQDPEDGRLYHWDENGPIRPLDNPSRGGGVVGAVQPNVEFAAALRVLRDRDQRTSLERMGFAPSLSPERAAVVKKFQDGVMSELEAMKRIGPPGPTTCGATYRAFIRHASGIVEDVRATCSRPVLHPEMAHRAETARLGGVNWWMWHHAESFDASLLPSTPPTPEEREADDGETLRVVTVGHDDTVREHWLHRGVYTPEPTPDPHVRVACWGSERYEFEQETPEERTARRTRELVSFVLREHGRHRVIGTAESDRTTIAFTSLDDRIREIREHRESDCRDPGCRMHRRPERGPEELRGLLDAAGFPSTVAP